MNRIILLIVSLNTKFRFSKILNSFLFVILQVIYTLASHYAVIAVNNSVYHCP